MRDIRLDAEETVVFAANSEGVRFLLLGEEEPKSISRKAKDKIRRSTTSPVRSLWGTLGMADDSTPKWQGRISFSRKGNLRSLPSESRVATVEEIAHVKEGRSPALNTKGQRGRILERCIALDDVLFPEFPKRFTLDEIPKLRLTLMLKQDEGAVVFYQYMPTKDEPTRRRRITFEPFDPSSDYGKYLKKAIDGLTEDGSAVEYVQPQPTHSHDCSGRDRLTYLIPILPGVELEPSNQQATRFRRTDVTTGGNFVIKVLTFRRENSQSSNVVSRMQYHLQGHSHQLLLWEPSRHRFEVRDGSALDGSRRTLLLIHGTFSETALAFKGLIEGDAGSWIARMHGSGKRQYPQIIAFDHPTLSEGPDATVDALLDRFPRGFYFRQPVDFISHSRGGLVGKTLGIRNPFPLRRGVLVACANGVGYFTAGQYVAKLLSVTKALLGGTGHPVLSFITGLAQHSADWFLGLPGCQAMTPGSDALNAVMRVPPNADVKYLPIIGDFEKRLVREQGLIKRWSARTLDLMIKPLLGREHDWVVGTRAQSILPPRSLARGYSIRRIRKNPIAARHSDYFYKKRTNAQQRISKFL